MQPLQAGLVMVMDNDQQPAMGDFIVARSGQGEGLIQLDHLFSGQFQR